MKARPKLLGVERRRKWTSAEKAQFLEEALQPGVTVASVADKHGISRGLFHYRMAKARAGLLPGVTLNGVPTPRFVPVRLAQNDMPADAIPMSPKAPATRIGSGVIEIVLGNGRVLKARETIEPAVPESRPRAKLACCALPSTGTRTLLILIMPRGTKRRRRASRRPWIWMAFQSRCGFRSMAGQPSPERVRALKRQKLLFRSKFRP